jgi:hypothetical protein
MPFSAPYSTSTPEGTTRGRMTTGGHPGDGGVFQPEAAPVQTGHIGRGAAHGTSLPDPTNRPPKSPVCYFRTASSSRQACSQRRQACSQARQCWKWGACRALSSPQLLQVATQASSSGRVMVGS